MSEIATRQSFLTGLKRRFGECTLPVSGQTVRFRSLSEREQSDYEMSTFTRNDDGNLVRNEEAIRDQNALLIVLCLVDSEGNPLLTRDDIPQVGLLDSQDSRELLSEIRLHCGIDKTPEQIAAAREAKKKRYVTMPGSGSATA